MSRNNVGNESGVTLVEVMIALVVLLLVMMGLLMSALLSIDHNTRNLLREEAISVAASRMEEAKVMPFDSLANDTATAPVTLPLCGNPPVSNAGPYPFSVQRDVRNRTSASGNPIVFGTARTVLPLDAATILAANTAQIQVLVRWEWKDECYGYVVTTTRRRT